MQPILLINTNEIKPPVAPIGLDYLGGTLARSGHSVEVIDLNFTESPVATLRKELRQREFRVVGVSFRNSDDCFWPSGSSFIPRLRELCRVIRGATSAPILLGGAGFSVFPETILQLCGGDFGIRGGGERPFLRFLDALDGRCELSEVDGLVWEEDGSWVCNPLGCPTHLELPVGRDILDNERYSRQGGQLGLETRRGCGRRCTYCADPLTKGNCISVRAAGEVADEAEGLVRRGINVLHLCDSEFNVPIDHALAVCREFQRRGLGDELKWYAYVSPLPFSRELARAMRAAGCVGLDFGVDSASSRMLATYGRRHRKEDIRRAVNACREAGIRVMVDLLLGGPGETPETVRETIEFIKRLDPTCAGAALGVRLYPGTPLTRRLSREAPLRENPNVRCMDRPGLDLHLPESADELIVPAFYISTSLGPQPAAMVRDVIGEDERFFPPSEARSEKNYNYNQNRAPVEAIGEGARGAYWDILRQLS